VKEQKCLHLFISVIHVTGDLKAYHRLLGSVCTKNYKQKYFYLDCKIFPEQWFLKMLGINLAFVVRN